MEHRISRRSLLKRSALTLGSVAACDLGSTGCAVAPAQDRAAVYFTTDISVDGLLKIYSRISAGMTGKIGIKLHSGEPNGPNLLPIGLIKGLQPTVPNSAIVECNVLYPSPRQAIQGHLEAVKTNGLDFCPVDIMDRDGDAMLPVSGEHLTEIAVGKSLPDYDSLLVYTHFKGHAMGGFGGSLKNIAVGCSSGKVGKLQIHGEGWERGTPFLERMVEAGKGITGHFGPHITYINVLKNISVDCDCDANAAKPTCGDIGILGSTDILAIDQASVDLVYAQPEDQRHDIVERIESRTGLHQLEYMKTLEMGNNQYELITL